jgi:hypothetical protein
VESKDDLAGTVVWEWGKTGYRPGGSSLYPSNVLDPESDPENVAETTVRIRLTTA